MRQDMTGCDSQVDANLLRDRERLRALLTKEALLCDSDEQPVRTADGRRPPWRFYSWNISLDHEGASLAASCLLRELRSFESTQLASHGYAGIPLMAACVAASGRHSGLAVRHERKNYGSGRLIEGRGDRARPVVVIDDCLVTGISLSHAVRALEGDGYRVEGVVTLVEFPERGGRRWAESIGLRVATVFDVWADLQLPRLRRPEWCRPFVTTGVFGDRLADGISPTAIVRAVAEAYANRRRIPGPPGYLDRSYDAAGGVFVSIRSRDTDTRLSRDGFFRVPPAAKRDVDIGRDLLAVALRAMKRMSPAISPDELARIKFAVTFVGPLEAASLGDLDHTRFGILIQGKSEPWRLAASPPNTEFASSEGEQYALTSRKLGMGALEARSIYRFAVRKVVENGQRWPEFGAPTPDRERDLRLVGPMLLSRARAAIQALNRGVERSGLPLEDASLPFECTGVGVSIYRNGILGCWVIRGQTLDECLVRAARGAWRDPRFSAKRVGVRPEDVTVLVAVMHGTRRVRHGSATDVGARIRPGIDSVFVKGKAGSANMLSYVSTHFDWGDERMAREVARKAGIAENDESDWRIDQTECWSDSGDRIHRLIRGFAEARERSASELAAIVARYIGGQVGADGLPAYSYHPISGKTVAHGSAARLVLALDALGEAGRWSRDEGLQRLAHRGLEKCLASLVETDGGASLELPGCGVSAGGDVLLLSALSGAGGAELSDPRVALLRKKVLSMFHTDGAITNLAPGKRIGADHDLLPGAALYAIARHALATGTALPPQIPNHLAWYRRRFSAARPWVMVSWHLQAWSLLHRITGSTDCATFVRELVDAILERQSTKSGAFVLDTVEAGPTFHTAVIAEGLADAWQMGIRNGDARLAERCRLGWQQAVRFMSSLCIQDADSPMLAEGQRAVGGIRGSVASALIRVDYPAHFLLALTKGLGVEAKA